MEHPQTACIVAWSGGKDSCLACYAAVRQGYAIAHLANFISQEYGRVRFHGIKAELIRAQALAVGLPLLQKETVAEDYEAGFKEGIRSLLSDRIGGLVFGDIHLQHSWEWAERVSRELGLQVVEPLWGRSTEEILLDFINSGFHALVVSTQANLLGEEWVGRPIDLAFLNDLKERGGVDLCGENGEYHTFVLDGPIFRERVTILEAGKVLRDGYWFLDIRDFALSPKVGSARDAS